ncbi:ADP-heptose:LPS heptosyltransferase [Pseudarthrobacter enclensis]|uniref:Glycosyl transferase n=1 Tax=Pseudarthrobacter enclensis TaxID=993070 RepID=A0A0V8IH50_9MICC|nr:glycosyltransferase family 9 protein [Pseudarthrobacter enclensis]KSU74085.1 glycosyl transferase [Pseudarthrobacter enclensis]SCC21713.1 ADP-heptose:LPS heptosyltransferase [Pseudarthrobacter enclensis]
MGRVLVARLDSMGDVLLAGPAVRAVANGRSGQSDSGAGNHVVMLCGRQGEAAAGLLPGAAEVYSWDSPWIMNPAPAMTGPHADRLIEYVRNSRISEAVILTSFHQSPLPLALLLRLAGVERITGASTDYAGSLLDVRLKPGEDFPEDQPEAERALGIAEAAGFRLPPGDDGKLRLADIPDVRGLVGDEPYVVVHPGAAVPARAWPPLHHAAAVELLQGSGHKVVVTGGPNETSLTATVAGPSALDLGGRTDLSTMAGVMAGAQAVVAGNTGPAHLAAAVGTPVVSLFSPVVPAIRWAPYGVPLELLGDQNAACRLTRARVCPVPGHPCLDSVSPEEVVAAVERLISGVSSLSTHVSTRRKARNR